MGRVDIEDARRRQLVQATIETMAEHGFNATTLALVAQRAGVSAGLVAHYFGDKDGLLEATLRELSNRVRAAAIERLATARDPRARIQAVIEANLSPREFDRATNTVWLAFWGQVLHSERLSRVQRVYQRRMLSTLRHAFKQVMPAEDAARAAIATAAMIDGLWLRATLPPRGVYSDAEARAMVTEFVDAQIAAHAGSGVPGAPAPIGQRGDAAERLGSHVAGRALRDPRLATFETINPATGAVLAVVEAADAGVVDHAVARAVEAQGGWAALTGMERGRMLRRVADLLRARNDELALLETQDTGKPIQETRVVDAISGAECFEYFAGLAGGLAGEHVDLGPGAFGYTRREPLGVVAGIGAWNYPLQIACWKSAPALAAGNAMLFKPAELTPLTALKLAEIMDEAGVPPGVFSVVQGAAETGRLLTRHPDIAKISLTGEVGTGKAVMADAASTLKHVTLELGGKSPLIVFPDADLDNAVSGALLANFYSAGEVCSNGTRVFVHERVRAEFLARLVARVERLRIGDPTDPETQIGALISADHMRKVLGYVERGVAEGARLLCGGNRVETPDCAQGYFVAPAVFDGASDEMAIAREEIFGPVMTVMSFAREDEVVARANATPFGLSAGVFTQDITRAHRVIAALKAGTCWINHYNVTPIELPFGGVKLSGLGRENGKAAIEHYTQVKSVYVALRPIDAPY